MKEYDDYPWKNKVDLSNLNNGKGRSFLREALFQLADLKLKPYTDETDKVGKIFDKLRMKADPAVFIRDVHRHIYITVKKLADADSSEDIIKIASRKWNENGQRWTYWQQRGEGLIGKKGHKGIYKSWPVSMQELSDVHRDVEALNHLLHYAVKQGVDKGLLAKAIKAHTNKMVETGTLKKMTKPPAKLTRDDIPSNRQEWYTQWRGLRTAPGSRDRDVLRSLIEKYPF